jgi:FkbH-like protein
LADDLAQLLERRDPAFWRELVRATDAATTFPELMRTATLRRRALLRLGPAPGTALKIALVGGYSLQPLATLVEQTLFAAGIAAELHVGEFDGYVAELLSREGPLGDFAPALIFVLPAARRCVHPGTLLDGRDMIMAEVERQARELLELCAAAHASFAAELLLANFPLPPRFDPGPFRARTLASEWSFKKAVNLELGLRAPPYVQLVDREFLTARRGLLASSDDRRWFESKQPGSPEALVDLAREVAHVAASLRCAPKKVLALDLDNTLWGGVIGDDGMSGIEIGTTSPRGEAFRALQAHALELSRRGVLLAVCSKNEEENALAPFLRHPEMLLRKEHLAAFYANWNPKPDNLAAAAAELELGLGSFVFVDDNPAEIAIVAQFTPEVHTIQLGDDPSEYAAQLKDCRLFEPVALTPEDLARAGQYRDEVKRKELRQSVTDMQVYLRALDMTAEIKPFTDVDAPRIAQLINKSNQFNLTTMRRSEAEVRRLIDSPRHPCFTLRLSDRFGDHGLVVVVITELGDADLHIDTWLMSCRVLNRQVEELTVNQLFAIARANGSGRVVGRYLPTSKNKLVANLYPKMGFTPLATEGDGQAYARAVDAFVPFATHIAARSSRHDPG